MIQIGAVLDGAVMNLNHSVCLGCVVWPRLSAELHANDAAVSVCFSLSTEVHRRGHPDVHMDASGGDRLQVGLKSKLRHLTSDRKIAQLKRVSEVRP